LSGNQGTAEVTLRVRPGTSGSGNISVGGVTLQREGSVVRVPIAASAVLPVLAP